MKINIHIILSFLLFFVHVNAQDIIVSDIPNLNQLPTNEINCFFQDSDGFMWYGTEGGGLCRDDGYLVKIFRSDINTPKLLESNSILCISEDTKGNIWFGTKRGAYILNKNDYSILPVPDPEIKSTVIKALKAVGDGTIWISSGTAVYRYDESGIRIDKYEMNWHNEPKEVRNIYEDNVGNVWMLQWRGGLLRFNSGNNEFVSYLSWPYKSFPTCIIKDASSDYFWIGTWGDGIVRFNPSEYSAEKMFTAQLVTNQNLNVFSKRIHNITQDNIKHNIWVTTADNMMSYSINEDYSLQPIDLDSVLPKRRRIAGNNLVSDRLGNVWVTDLYLNPVVVSSLSEKIVKYSMSKLEEELDIPVYPTAISYENNYFWIKQRFGRLHAYNPIDQVSLSYSNHRLSPFLEPCPDLGGVYSVMYDSIIVHFQNVNNKIFSNKLCTVSMKEQSRIRTLHNDKQGNLWIGTSNNLLRYNLAEDNLYEEHTNIGIINKIITSEKGDVFLATESEGFWNISNGDVIYKYNSDENYLDLTIDNRGNVWISSQSGNIYCYNPSNNDMLLKTYECGLEGDIVSDIESDDKGNVWMLTTRKLIVYSPELQTFNIIHSDSPSVLLNSFLTLTVGQKDELYVAGREGIIEIDTDNPLNDARNRKLFPISGTFIKVNNNIRVLQGKNNQITLSPKERNIELFFSTFDHLNTNDVRYAFRYKDDSWNYLPIKQNSLYLTRLSKGKHEIEIIATDENGVWCDSSTVFLIKRLPDWYETWYSYLLYFIIVVSTSVFFIRGYLKYKQEKNQKLIEEQVVEMKYRFFTNISHELRTPLTLIITPLDNIIQRVSDVRIKEQLESIGRNAQNLLSLFNQLLDFRKIEIGGDALYLSQGNINDFISSIYDDFRLISTEKKIQFELYPKVDLSHFFFDSGKLKKVLNNLLSNAFKFTDEYGVITVSLQSDTIKDRDYAVISISDTGKGIPAQAHPKIFDRFFQVNNQDSNTEGSGIGLHMAKEYVEMHEGFITVQSEVDKGTTFSVFIPTDLNSLIDTPVEDLEKSNSDTFSIQPDLSKKILIVEDNNEFRAYLRDELSQYFTVFVANDGCAGEREAIMNEPDIIITDLMMPGMSGIELCKRIKNNIEISHIPVILLTANTDIKFEMQGYKEGADAYISKPFLLEILLFRIDNLINQVLKRKQDFGKETKISPDKITISKADELFVTKIIEVVEKNLENSEYTVEDFSEDMCMSRANLYRKINSITGFTPSEFMKNIRLKKAAELIKDGIYPIVEIAEMVGFNTHSYFTKSFKEMFGVPPSSYQKNK